MTVIVIYKDDSVLARPCSDFRLDSDMGTFFLDREENSIADVNQITVDGTTVFSSAQS